MDHLSNKHYICDTIDVVTACLSGYMATLIFSDQECRRLVQYQTHNHIPINAHQVTIVMYTVMDTCP